MASRNTLRISSASTGWLIVASVLALLPIAVIPFVFHRFSLLGADHAFESLVCAVLVFFTLFALIEAARDIHRLRKSKHLLVELQESPTKWAHREGVPNDGDLSYAAVILGRLRKMTAGTERLPSAADLVVPTRLQAEGSAVMLRWFAGASVLVGLLGTVFALSGAIDGALLALAKASVGDGSEMVKELSRALKPLSVAFISSGSGVFVSIVLTLLRQVYEAQLEEHFAEFEFDLQSQLRTYFPEDWTSPEEKIVGAAQAIVKNGEQLQGLSKDIKVAMAEILTSASQAMANSAKAIENQIKPMAENVVPAIRDGLSSVGVIIAQQTEVGLNRSIDVVIGRFVREAEGWSKSLSDNMQQQVHLLQSAATAQSATLSATEAEMRQRGDDVRRWMGETVDSAAKTHAGLTASSEEQTRNFLAAVEQTLRAFSKLADDISSNTRTALGGHLTDATDEFSERWQATETALLRSVGQLQTDLLGRTDGTATKWLERIEKADAVAVDLFRRNAQNASDHLGRVSASMEENAKKIVGEHTTMARESQLLMQGLLAQCAATNEAMSKALHDYGPLATSIAARIEQASASWDSKFNQATTSLAAVHEALAPQVEAVTKLDAGLREVGSSLHAVATAVAKGNAQSPLVAEKLGKVSLALENQLAQLKQMNVLDEHEHGLFEDILARLEKQLAPPVSP